MFLNSLQVFRLVSLLRHDFALFLPYSRIRAPPCPPPAFHCCLLSCQDAPLRRCHRRTRPPSLAVRMSAHSPGNVPLLFSQKLSLLCTFRQKASTTSGSSRAFPTHRGSRHSLLRAHFGSRLPFSLHIHRLEVLFLVMYVALGIYCFFRSTPRMQLSTQFLLLLQELLTQDSELLNLRCSLS